MDFVRKLWRFIFIFFIIMMISSCVGKKGPEGPASSPPGTVNPSKALDITPAAFVEDTESIITLSYSDSANGKASSCSINTLTNITVTKGCSCSAGGCTVGVKGSSNFFGAASFRYQVTIGSITTSNGTASLTITPVNDAPTIDSIAAQTVNKNAVKVVNYKLADVDSTITCAGSVTKTSSDTTLVPLANIVLAGTVPNCTATITPVTNLYGSSDIQLTATDGSLTASRTFTLTVVNYNYPPTITFIANATTTEDTAKAISFTIDDVDSVTQMNCTAANLSIFSSSSGTLIPGVAGSDVIFSGTYPNCVATFTPVLNQNGNSNIIIRVSDNGSGIPASQTVDSNAFKLTVTAVDDPPVANNFSPVAFNEDTASIITLNYTDVENDRATLCTVSNLTNVTVTNACSCSLGVCTVGVKGTLNYNGPASFNFNVTANGSTSNTALATLTINALNDSPTITAITAQVSNEDTATGAIVFTINDLDSTLNCTTSMTANSSNTAVVANAGITFAGTAPNCTVTINPVLNASGTSTITLTVSDGALNATSPFVITINAVNDAPTISTITAQSTNENVVTSAIPFTINDVDSTITCATSVTATSTNTALIPNANIAIAGTAPNCTVTITPVASANGNSTITLTVTDGALSNQSNFVLTVVPVNDPPTISAITAQTTNEDTATSAITFTINDIDSTLDCATSVSGASTNTNLIDGTGMTFAGTAPSCTVILIPKANANGSSTITLTVSDGSMSVQSIFSLTVNAVNDAPVISAVTAQSTNENTATGAIAFTINDVDSTLTCASSLTATSSAHGVVLDAGVVIAGTAPNCTATITPVTNANGPSTITLTVNDGTLTATSTFVLTVNAINNPPTITFISNVTTNEDTSVNVDFVIDDVDSITAMTCTTSNLGVFSSSNGTLIPGIAGSDIIFSGTYPNCRATFTPALNQNGVSNIVIRVTDNGSPTPVKTTDSNAFTLTVTAVNDAPMISTITAQSTNEDTATGAIAFTINDIDSTLTCASSVSGVSSAHGIVLDAGIVIAGTFPNCTATITPVANANGPTTITLTVTDGTLTATSPFVLTVNAVNDTPTISVIGAQSTNEDTATSAIAFTINDADSTLTCATSVTGVSSNTVVLANAGIVFAGTAPNCTATLTPVADASGTSTVTLTVTDGNTSAPSIFVLTVTAVNDAPIISTITAQSTNEDTATGAIAFTINDIDSTLTCASSVSGISSAHGIVLDAGIVIAGTFPNCTATITPVANANGPTTITLTVTDGTLTATSPFVLTVNAVNDTPTITAISAQTTNEDTVKSGVAFTINDADSTLSCATSVTGVSSNTGVLANTGITFAGTAPSCTVILTPVANANGTSTVTLTVTDGNSTAQSVFVLTVTAVNDAPTISAITAKTTNENTVSSAIPFTVGDIDSTLTCSGAVSGVSSDTAIVDANIVIAGTYPNCTATITPVTNANGPTTITLTVTDGTLTSTSSFALTVAAVNNPPTITFIADANTNEDTSVNIDFTINDIDSTTDMACTSANLAIYSSSNGTLIPGVSGSDVVFSGTYPDCTATFTPSLNQNGSSNVVIRVTDNGLPTPVLSTDSNIFKIAVTPVNDAPIITAITAQSTNEDTATGAIAFTINDIDSSLTCAGSVAGTSSATSVVANASIVIAGTAPNCTATITPVANANGPTTITLTVTDSALTATSAFILTVNAVNDTPTISAITAQTTNEDTAKSAIAFTINDTDSTLSCATSVTGVSSNTGVLANAGITFAGTAPNCTATLTPIANANGVSTVTLTVTDGNTTAQSIFVLTVTAVNDAPTISNITSKSTNESTATSAIAFTIGDVDSTLTCAGSVSGTSSDTALVANGNIVVAGTYPNCNVTVTPVTDVNGSANITLTVTDGTLSATSVFALTINPVNNAPIISAIIAQSTNEDTASSAIDFTINDIDSTLNCATSVSAISSNTGVIANAGITFSGTAPDCTVTLNPVADANGTSTITLTVTDGSLTAQTNFVLTVTAVNDAPTISAITAQSTNEDTTIGAIAFTINDIDSSLTCAGSVSGTSSATSVVASANIVITGTAPNCTATITPVSNANGPTTITLTLTDTALTATSAFVLTVNAINDTPTITAISAQTTNEDTAKSGVAFTISDTDSTLSCATSVTGVSSNTGVIANAGITFVGTAPSCTATLTPVANANGTSTVTITVTDGNTSTQSVFVLTVTAVNDAPTVSAITAKTTNENTVSSAIPFIIGDIDSTLTCASSVSKTSSDTAVVLDAGIVIGGTYPNCTATITPVTNSNGPTTITLTVTDGTLTSTSAFTFTVAAVNNPPTITFIPDATTDEDTSVNIDFTINDIDSTTDMACSSANLAIYSSSNGTLIPGISGSDVVFSGTYPDCTATFTPSLNQNGSSNIVIRVTDNGLPTPVLSTDSNIFKITVTAVNDAPAISAITAKSTNEDTVTSAIAFTINDIDSTLTCASSVSGASSATSVVASANIVITGTAPNCTVTITPVANANGPTTITLTVTDTALTATSAFVLTVNAVNDTPTISAISAQSTNEDTAKTGVAFTINDTDSTLSCATSVTAVSSNTGVLANAGIAIAGTAPNCTVALTPVTNATGNSTVTLTVTDGNTTAQSTFVLTVTAVNDAPTITAIANKTTNESTATSAIAFTIGDVDSTLTCTGSISAASSDTAIVDADIVIAGTYPNCTVTVTPVTDANGSADITLTVTDGTLTATSVFTLTVNPVNNAPTISTISAQAIDEDTASSAINFTINDIDSTLSCATSVSAISSNTGVIANAGIVFGGTAPNCTVTLTPVADANGTSTITLTATDGSLTAQTNFVLTVAAVNDAPTISAITAQSTNEDTATGAIAFTINDIDSTLTCATAVTKSSSVTSIVPNANIVITGTAPNCTATITPVANANGPTTITLTVSDGTLSSSNVFVLTVNAVNDTPTITAIGAQTTNEDTAKSAIAFTIADTDSTLSCATSVTGVSSNTGVLANAGITFAGTAPSCTVTLTPVANANGTSTVTLTVTDGNTSSQSVFVLTVTAVNDAPTITAITAKTTNENTVSSAIPFMIGDIDSTLTCASSVSKASSDTAIVLDTNIVIGGTYPNCTATITPETNANGPTTITLTVTDGTLTATSSFVLTVAAVNNPPTITFISDATTDEDSSVNIDFTIGDIDSTTNMACSSANLAIYSSSNGTLIPGVSGSDVVFSGTYPDCTATFTPSLNQNESSNVVIRVTDNGLPTPVLSTDSNIFKITVSAVNDAPTISAITAQSTTEDTATGAIAFTINDIDSTLTCASSVSGTSSATSVVASANIVITGTAPNCIATITPVANANGPTAITLTVTDSALTATSAFVLTVNAVNDTPTITAIGAQTTNEDTAKSAIAFTITDADSTLSCATSVTGVSSNTAVLANSGITFSGTAPSCTVTLTPVANANGTSTVTLNVTDGNTTAQSTFVLTVTAVNDTPTISAITAQTTLEDTATGGIAFTINDIDSTLTCASSVTVTSSNTAVLDAGVALGGTAPNCTVTLTPVAAASGTSTITLTLSDGTLSAQTSFVLTVNAINNPPTVSFISNVTTNEDTGVTVDFDIDDSDSSTTMICTAANIAIYSSSNGTLIPGIVGSDVVFTGTYPNCHATFTPMSNQTGTSNIVIRVTDNGSPTPVKSVDSNIFTITVNAVNDAPVISTIAAQSTNEDTASGAIAFTINDIDSTLTCAGSVSATTSNTAVLDTGIVIAGTAPNCTITLTPVANASGTSTVSLTVTDGSLTAAKSFVLTVNAVNDVPVISAITARSTTEDTATSAIAFTITDTDSTLDCAASVTGISSNTAVLLNTGIVFGGTAPNCTVTLTPVANGNGATTVTLTVTDGSLTATSVFTLTVTAVDDVPVISSIANQTIEEDTSTSPIAFTVSDIDSTVKCSDVIGTSSDQAIILDTSISISGGAGTACTVTITPVGDANGNGTVITLTLGTTTSTFTLNITPVPDILGSLTVDTNLTGVASAYSAGGTYYTRKLNFNNSISVDEAVSVLEVCLGTTAGGCEVVAWGPLSNGAGNNKYTTSGTAPTIAIDGNVKLGTTSSSFALTHSCSAGATTNYYFSVRITNGSGKKSIITSSGWSFWEPSCLNSALTQWLDASENSTITSSSTKVSNWLDKTSNAHDVSQGNSSDQPIYSTTELAASFPGITFDGTSTTLLGSSFAYAQGNATVFAVVNGAAANAEKYLFSEGSSTTTAYYAPLMNSTTNTVTGKLVDDSNLVLLTPPTTSTTIFNGTTKIVMAKDTGSSFSTYSNGVIQTQGATTYTRGTSTIDTFVLGAKFKSNTASDWFSGTMSEFMIMNGAVTPADRERLEGYLAHKWGASGGLQSGHAYKAHPPAN